MAYHRDDDDDEDPELPDPSDTDDDGSADQDLLAPCPHCRKMMYDDSEQCPHCGQYVARGNGAGHSWWVLLTAAVVLVLMVLFLIR